MDGGFAPFVAIPAQNARPTSRAVPARIAASKCIISAIVFAPITSFTLSAWIANYNGEDLYTGNPWSSCDCCNAWTTGCSTANWTYWQVSSTGSIPGISDDTDLDAYPLSLADLKVDQGVGE